MNDVKITITKSNKRKTKQMTTLDLTKTVYIPIDIQDGIVNTGNLEPYTSDELLNATNHLTHAFKNTDALIALVKVDARTFYYLHPSRATRTQEIHVPKDYDTLLPTIATDETADNVITVIKHNPSAFFGTDLDLQLRRRGIDTIILSGVTTSNGVYATALDAFQHSYHLYIISDATTDRDAELHQLFFDKLYPKLGTVITMDELSDMIKDN